MILTIAIPDISSKKGVSIVINFFSPSFTITFSCGNIGINLLKNLKLHSLESITPSNLNKFLIPRTISTLLNISDTNMNTSNLCLFISPITGITNNTPTY